MKDIKFNNGMLKIDPVKDKELAVFLTFNGFNKGGAVYIAVEKSLPKIKGLKRKMKRAEFTIELVNAMKKNGVSISLKS